MSSSSPWDAYSQHPGLPSSLEPYAHPFSADMRSLASGTATSGMPGLPAESMLGYPKSADLSAAALTSPYSAYGQSYPGMPDLGFPGASLRPSSAAHSPAAADNLPAASPHGQFAGTPTSEAQSSSPAVSNSNYMYSPPSTSSISTSPYAQAFGSSAGSAADASSRGSRFSPFAQSYPGYPSPAMYGYNPGGSFPSANPLEGVNRYMGGISSAQLMQSSAMAGLYSNSQASQMPFPYHPSMGMSYPGGIPGFPPLSKENPDLMSPEELERYRYRQLSNPYFPGMPTGGPPSSNFPPHPLQQGMIRSAPFIDDRVNSPAPKKQKKSTEEADRPPTPTPRDPALFHSERGIYLFTSNPEPGQPNHHSDRYLQCEKELCQKLSRVSLPGKIQYVYNPLEYAFESHLKFTRRFCTGEKYILFVGMNPGPFGMVQNGVPFGECQIVKEWLQIDGEVLKPVLEHPKRRVVGLDCSRSEVTGGRFWQLFRTLCQTPEHFFSTSYVHNLCPFAFLTDSGKNVTPPQLTSSVLDQINNLCNATLVEVVRLLKCKYVICIGKYALAQAQKALSADEFSALTLECLMHPSPINPAANKGWADIAIKQLTEIGIIDVIQYGRLPYQQQQNQQPPAQPAMSQPPHASPSPMNHISQQQQQQQQLQHNPYQTKQSPSHFPGFQSPPIQPYHQSPAQTNNHHGQSPGHATPNLSQSPAHVPSTRNQTSPAHASSRPQSSPAHSSCSQSPAHSQQNPTMAPSQSPSHAPVPPLSDQLLAMESQKHSTKDNCDINSQNSTLDTSAADKSQEGNNTPHVNNGIPTFSGDSQSQENGLQNSLSESGSQGSDVSKGNSPTSVQYPPAGNQPTNSTESQMGLQNQQMGSTNPHMQNVNQMSSANQQMHMPSMGPGHPHMGMSSMAMSDSPSVQQSPAPDQHQNLVNQQIGSPQMAGQAPHLGVSQNSHMGSMNSHMPSQMPPQMSMGSQLGPSGMGVPMSREQGMGLHGQMGSMNPYNQQHQMEMSQQMGGSYGTNSMSHAYPGMRPNSTEVSGYGGGPTHMGMPNPSGMGMPHMSGMHQSGNHMPSQQQAMYNQHMSRMMGGPGVPQEQQMGMQHAGLNSMYESQMGKEMPPYGNHYTDKPPECS